MRVSVILCPVGAHFVQVRLEWGSYPRGCPGDCTHPANDTDPHTGKRRTITLDKEGKVRKIITVNKGENSRQKMCKVEKTGIDIMKRKHAYR